LLLAYLQRLIEDEPCALRLEPTPGGTHWKTHDLESRAADYLGFVRTVVDQRPRRQFIVNVADELSALGAKSR